MEEHIQLQLTLSSQDRNRKRVSEDAFSDVTSRKRTLPLFEWNDNNHKSDADVEDDVVGWPPVKPRTKKLCEQNRRECTAANYIGGGSSMYVKVEMEGIVIARKLDLSIHYSYQSLAATLMPLFGKCEGDVEMYKLTYQDKEGDWLLAGDVPWGNFIESVRRLKLVKNEFR